MKQRTKILMALMLTMSLTACGVAPEADSTAKATKVNNKVTEATTKAAEGAANEDPYKAAEGAANEDPYKAAEGAANEDTAKNDLTPSEGAKYSTTVTDDNWVKVENEGGETLGVSQTSNVKLIEDEGFAFKDLNQNGKLDVYEDWRVPNEERAKDLVDQMKGPEMAAVLTHGGWGGFTTEPLAEDDGSYTYLMSGGRGGVSRNISKGGGAHAKWANAIQEVAESSFYGIPAMISIDPGAMSGMGLIKGLSLASTMNPELAAEIGKETAKQCRAFGFSALLGPQVDIASPIMSRAGGTYGEDPQLTLDIATAYVNAMQSTYDEENKDLGWGNESVYCFTKHFAGAGATEGGRDDHNNAGRYAIFPGNSLEAHLITYFDGVFKLPGKTGTSGIMTEYAINVDADGNPYGGEWAAAYNPYLNNMLDEAGFDGLKITDWGVYQYAGSWGTEEMEETDRIAASWERGANILGGYSDVEKAVAAYGILAQRNGEDGADKIMREATLKFVDTMMNLNMFDMPYSDSAYADSIVESDASKEYAVETQKQSVVMIKNDGTISKDGAVSEKPTVYIPYVYNTGFSAKWQTGIAEGVPTWTPGMDLDVMGQYFNIVTDKLGEPTGEKDADGKAAYTKDDLTRADVKDIAACDYVLAGMGGAYMNSYNALMTGAISGEPAPEGVEDEWYPASLQYGEYVADTARETSVSGKVAEDGTKENRSYKGVKAHEVANYGDLEALEYAAEAAGDVPVIVSMKMDRGMVWGEVEPLADVILVNYNQQRDDVVAEVILGKTEPSGLLVFQQPASMEAVEAQADDVPRDMECYKDAAGNTYDFTFGMDWSGVIDDERTAKYSAEPLTKLKNFDYAAYEKANK